VIEWKEIFECWSFALVCMFKIGIPNKHEAKEANKEDDECENDE
jgi:hypothetical protein